MNRTSVPWILVVVLAGTGLGAFHSKVGAGIGFVLSALCVAGAFFGAFVFGLRAAQAPRRSRPEPLRPIR